jgi:hypothetical protein
MALSITVTERWQSDNKRYSRGQIATNNTTYATGGLALPAKGQFGFQRQMDSLMITGESPGPTTQYLVTWDKTNNKLQFFEEEATAAGGPLLEEGAVALGTRLYDYVASGW